MAKNPKHRFATVAQVQEALDHVGSYSPTGAFEKSIHAWQEKQIRKHAERGKTVNPVIVAVITALIIGGGAFTFKDKIVKFIEPAERRYHHAVEVYDRAITKLDYQKAETASIEALNIADEERKQWLVPSLVRVIDLYRVTGRFKAADNLYDRLEKLEKNQRKSVFKGEKTVLGKLTSLINEGPTEQDDLDRVEDYCYQLNDIASSYMDASLWYRARTLLKRTIRLASQVLPEDNLVVINLIDNLAILDLKDNLNEKYVKVRANLEEAVAKRKKIAGRTSAGLFATLQAISEIDLRLGNLDDAQKHAQEALTIARNTYQPTSPQAAEAKCQLSEVYLAKNRVSKALSYLETAAVSLERSSAVSDVIRARTYYLLAEALRKSDDYNKAIERYKQALDFLKEGTDKEILLKADVYRGLGDIYTTRARKDNRKAESYYLNSLLIMLRSQAREESKVLDIISNLSRMYREQNQNNKTQKAFLLIEHVDKKTGKTNGVIEDKLLLAEYYRENSDLKKSAAYLEDALSLSESFYGFEGSKTAQISSRLADTYMLRDNYEKAKLLIEKPVSLIRSDNLTGELTRSAKLKILSTYARYLDHVNNKEELSIVKEEIDKL